MTTIEWTRGDDGSLGKTWNPIRGCSIVSAGCEHCYAMRQAHRFSGPGGTYEGLTRLTSRGPVWTGDVRLVPEVLDLPLRWRKPHRVFVNSMADLFHEGVPDEYIDRVFAVMALAPRHTFQILTKRPERMAAYILRDGWRVDEIPVPGARQGIYAVKNGNRLEVPRIDPDTYTWPLPNVLLGTSAENQETFDERMGHLSDVSHAGDRDGWRVFLSLEPLLGPIDLSWPGGRGWLPERSPEWKPGDCASFIDWVIVGGESGPRARPCDVEWIREIVRVCTASATVTPKGKFVAGVPVFVKQLGAQAIIETALDWSHDDPPSGCSWGTDGKAYLRLADRKGADQSEWPEDLRRQEFPA